MSPYDATPGPCPDRLRDDLAHRLTQLSDGGRLQVVEIGDQGITTVLAGIDKAGLLRCGRPRTTPWEELDPALDHSVPRAVAVPAGHPVVLVCTAPDSPMPKQALEILQRHAPEAAAEHAADADVIATLSELVAATPLRTKLELVVAHVHPRTGELGLHGHPLFQAGALVGEQQRLAIRCPHTLHTGTVLAIVTWHDGRPHPVSIDSVQLPAGTHQLRAVLAGPGHVTFTEPPGVTPDPRPWSQLRSTLPARITQAATEVDLVCCVDLSAYGFGARRELVAGLIELLNAEYPEPGRLNAAVIGYGDHAFRTRANALDPPSTERVVFGTWLVPPDQAVDRLHELEAVEPGPWRAAPVEDALARVARRMDTIPAGRKVILLTVGDRPPHPPREGPDGVLPCPNEHDWQRLLRRIEERADLVSIAVLDSGEYAGPTWRQLGRTALHPLAKTDPHRLAITAGVIVPAHHRLPFPLLDDDA